MRERPPIFGFNANRQALIGHTVRRVLSDTTDALHALNDAAYHECRRLDGAKRPKDVDRLEAWRTTARRLGRMDESERRTRLKKIVEEYARDIAGNFNPRVYGFTTRMLPTLTTALLAPSKLPPLLTNPVNLLSHEGLGDKVVVEGPLDTLRALADKGTLVFMPTHSSNMDSIVFGFALERAGLPPSTYGAGKNLFTNPVLAFFMRNLGAYRVDRRLRHRLYKECLKAYSCVLLEHGYHSLFFPGGTRSRSGCIEQKIKLGLMGTGIEAYTRSLMAGRGRRVFFVPATINYLITLEAETLVDDFLSEAGKEQFIIEDDESSRFSRVLAFMRKLLAMNGAVVIRFGAPLDPFGSAVDAHGQSRDRRGRTVDPASYLHDLDGEVCLDPARNAQYTRELAEAVVQSYRRNTIAMSTHIVAAACFEQLRQHSPNPDLFNVLRVRDVTVSRDELASEVLRIKDRVAELEVDEGLVLSDTVRDCSGGDIVAQALQAFRGYHSDPVIEPHDKGIALCDAHLLLYYQNRLAAHGLALDPLADAGRSA